MLRVLTAATALTFLCLMLTGCDSGGDAGAGSNEPIVPQKAPGIQMPDPSAKPG
ncbi:MAG TPA: hypothetical protein PK400_08495 [Phycisphaerales bacterium]|nr:hypothetical protein [Phycisphaerales bacterium]HRQ75443.1 hypothetical protein [Phycisphaerales bacterium]